MIKPELSCRRTRSSPHSVSPFYRKFLSDFWIPFTSFSLFLCTLLSDFNFLNYPNLEGIIPTVSNNSFLMAVMEDEGVDIRFDWFLYLPDKRIIWVFLIIIDFCRIFLSFLVGNAVEWSRVLLICAMGRIWNLCEVKFLVWFWWAYKIYIRLPQFLSRLTYWSYHCDGDDYFIGCFGRIERWFLPICWLFNYYVSLENLWLNVSKFAWKWAWYGLHIVQAFVEEGFF